jgi:hypothetical protein
MIVSVNPFYVDLDSGRALPIILVKDQLEGNELSHIYLKDVLVRDREVKAKLT